MDNLFNNDLKFLHARMNFLAEKLEHRFNVHDAAFEEISRLGLTGKAAYDHYVQFLSKHFVEL